MNASTDLRHMQALALMQENDPESTRMALCESGFGMLADEWIDATQEFSRVARHAERSLGEDELLGTHVVRAYARRCVTWARISQLRDQARRSVEHQGL